MRVFIARSHIVHVAYLDDGFITIIINGMDNHVVGTTHEALRFSIHVPVVADEVPLLVGACHHVRTEVNPPEAFTIEFVALVVVELGRVGGIADVARVVALYHEFHHTVAIDIAQ